MAAQIRSVQYLRALAALMVVAQHATLAAAGFTSRFSFQSGASGVDIFFVLSGFIIYSTQGSSTGAGEFVYRRLIRIVPLYWVVTCAYLALNAISHLKPGALIPASHIIQSFLFIPHPTPGLPEQIYPLVIPGWTLCYEMFFYAVFAVGLLFLHGRSLLMFVTAAICGGVLAGRLLHPGSVILATYSDPLVLEFLAGVLMAALVERFRPHLAAGLLIPIGLAFMMIPMHGSRFFGWGVPAAMVVYGALALEPFAKARWPVLLGDASFSLYLTQFLVLEYFRVGWKAAGLPTDAILLSLFAIPTCIVVGIGVHLYVEKPLLGRLKKMAPARPGGRKAAPAAAV